MHPFKWNPSKILPLPAAPRVPASVPLLWSPRCFTTPIPLAGRRPQPPGDRPAHGLAFPPALASLLSTLAERTKCNRKNEYECQEPIPLPPTEENLPLLSWIVKQEPSWTFTKLNRNRKESETDKEAKKSLWVEAGAGRPIFVWESKRCKERQRGFENLVPSLAFSQDWSQDLNCFSSIIRCWTGISLNEMLQRVWASNWFTKQALGETEDSRFISIPRLRGRAEQYQGLTVPPHRQDQAGQDVAQSYALAEGQSVCLHKPIVRLELRSLSNHPLPWCGFRNTTLSSHHLSLAIPNNLKSLHLSQDIPSGNLSCTFIIFPKASPLHEACPGHFSGSITFTLSKSWTSVAINVLEKHYMWEAVRKTAREM